MFLSLKEKVCLFLKPYSFFAKRTSFDDPLYGIITGSNAIEKYAHKSSQPHLGNISRDTLSKEIVDFYLESKQEHIDTFADLDCGLVVSCDLWTSFDGEDHYLCVVCHWVRDDSSFKNNVIGFELLYPFDYANVASKIVHVLDKYKLKDKINGISFEDGICKEKCMEHLVKEFNPVVPEMFYFDRTFVDVVDLCAQQVVDELAMIVDPFRELCKWFRCSTKKKEFRILCKGGIPPQFHPGFSKGWSDTIHRLKGIYKHKEVLTKEFNPVVPEMFYFDRTFVDVVDLCAQQVVDELAMIVDPFRELCKWFRCSTKKKEFRILCKGGIPPQFHPGFSKGWSDTIHRLKGIYKHKEVLTKLYNECENHCPLVDSQWDAMNSLVNLLCKFSDFKVKYHWAFDAGCHLVIQDCIIVVHTLRSYESDPRFGSVVRNVRKKWLKVFPEIPTIYCVATILDPRIQVEGLRQLLAYYYETLGVKYDVDEKVAHSINVLNQLIAHRGPPYEPETNSGEGKNKSSSSLEFNVIRDVLERKRKREDDQEKRDELGDYLSYEFEVPDDNEIFEWWAEKREILPVLSKVATDVLCTPMLTRIPFQKYCSGKRVLDKRRSMLPPGLLRVCICKTDWDLARKSNHGTNGYGGCDYGEFYTDYEEDD